jgi:hypothetical protein
MEITMQTCVPQPRQHPWKRDPHWEAFVQTGTSENSIKIQADKLKIKIKYTHILQRTSTEKHVATGRHAYTKHEQTPNEIAKAIARHSTEVQPQKI